MGPIGSFLLANSKRNTKNLTMRCPIFAIFIPKQKDLLQQFGFRKRNPQPMPPEEDWTGYPSPT